MPVIVVGMETVHGWHDGGVEVPPGIVVVECERGRRATLPLPPATKVGVYLGDGKVLRLPTTEGP